LGEKKSLKETIVDKNNHSWDTLKYYILSLSKPTPKPLGEFVPLTPEQKVKRWQEKRRKEIAQRNKGGGSDGTLGKTW
jgi:hypothetical protein